MGTRIKSRDNTTSKTTTINSSDSREVIRITIVVTEEAVVLTMDLISDRDSIPATKTTTTARTSITTNSRNIRDRIVDQDSDQIHTSSKITLILLPETISQ